MTRPTRAMANATRTAEAAADQLDAWLQQRGSVSDTALDAAVSGKCQPVAGVTAIHPAAVATVPTIDAKASEMETQQSAGSVIRENGSGADIPWHLPHTDWLHHRLVVAGATDALAAFRTAASGAGIIPWRLDGDRMAEDFFVLLAAPPAPQHRRLSLAAARALSRQLREAVELRHAAACARVGRSHACPFDLHALVPVPPAMLQLGPDEPEPLAWLWQHWGTTAPLRHVAVEPAPALRTPLPAGTTTLRLSFWSADWTPWRALADVRARWPALRFDVRPTYGPL